MSQHVDLGRKLENESLSRLHAAVRTAVATERAPLPDGVESRPIRAVEEYFGEAEWRDLTLVARMLSVAYPELFALFFGPMQARFMIVRELEDQETCPTVDELLSALSATLADTGPWICVVPLSNAVLPDGQDWVEIDDSTVLMRASDDRSNERWANDDNHHFALLRKFGDGFGPRVRYLTGPPWEDVIDTRQMTAIALLQGGDTLRAGHVAEARVKYATATWCLHTPPERRQVSPSVGDWSPQPWLKLEHRMTPAKRHHGARDKERIGRVTEYAPWPMPSSPELLKLPFRALDIVEDRHCSRALLSATYAYSAAVNVQTEIQLGERIMYLSVALESLAEPANHASGEAFSRWKKLISKLGLYEKAAEQLTFDQHGLDAVGSRVYDARNVFVHGSDSVLTNLGYPIDRERPLARGVTQGHQLSLAALHEGFAPMSWLIRHALLECWNVCADSDFDDGKFASLFSD